MSLLSHDSFWNAVISFPTTKRMLNLSLKKCPECGRTILEAALDDYVGKAGKKCAKCSGFYSPMIRFWIEFLRRSLSIKRKKVEKLLADPYARRAVINIARSFSHFGIRKPLSIYAPFLVVWDFTHKCNLSCKHCYSNSGDASEKELSTKEALNVVDQLADFGVTAVAFSGGEPLSRKGATATTHDSFRGVPGAFNKAIAGLRRCVEEDLCTCIATTATKSNYEEMPKILDLAAEIGAKRFTYFNFIPTGRGKEHFDQDLAPEEREKLMLHLLDRMAKGFKVTILTTAPQLARVALQCQGTGKELSMSMAHMQTIKVSKKAVHLADFIGGCGAGRLYCSISPQGDVHPCVFFPVNVGNLKTEKFGDIWLNSKLFKVLRDRSNLRGACGKCSYKYICGGCRARANAYYDDFLSSDPGCILAKEARGA